MARAPDNIPIFHPAGTIFSAVVSIPPTATSTPIGTTNRHNHHLKSRGLVWYITPVSHTMSCSGPATALRQAARCPARLGASRRAFSSTPSRDEMSQLRSNMFEWLNKLDTNMAKKGDGTQYLGGADQPFPNNPFFRSQPVLDENARETIWRRVQQKGEPMKVVSAAMGVDVRRVAAVVRLKEIEKRWVRQVRRPPPAVFLSATN